MQPIRICLNLLVLDIRLFQIEQRELSHSTLLCGLGVHSRLEDNVNFCSVLQCFFLYMSPDEILEKVERHSHSSLHNIVENTINIVPYQIA